MNSLRKLIPAVLMLAAAASAATLTGTVTNKTTGKPSPGDTVVLIKLGAGMDEVGRSKTDANGKYKFEFPDDGAPHLLRAERHSVTYNKQVPPGAATADIDVYDAAKKLDNISATVQVVRFQASGDKLQATELYAVKNASNPPRTLFADQTFLIELPDGAQVDDGQALSGNGLPVNSAPVPSDKKGQYYFVFPLRPGETRFQVNYHMPYSGSLSLDRKVLYPMEHFVVMVPKQMEFTPGDPAKFQSMGDDQGAITQVTTALKAGDTVAFKISGTGEFPPEGSEQAGSGGGAPDTRPGGGLGPPSDAPDPLHQYRWYILGALAVAMAGGAFYVLNKRPIGTPAAAPDPTVPTHAVSPARRAAASAYAAGTNGANGRSSLLLDALKEELFQLEVERQQGHITPAEYDKAKAALDVTIGRAIKRATPAVKTTHS